MRRPNLWQRRRRGPAERLYKQQNRGGADGRSLPTLLLAFVLIGGAAVTCLGSLWIEPDGSLHTPWLLTLGLSLTLSWGSTGAPLPYSFASIVR